MSWGIVMYKCIVYDMDGTLVNSYEGIFNAYQWVSERMGVEFGGAATVYQAIGSPLPYAFQQFWDMNPAQIPRAVAYYRDYYARKGKDQAEVYEGMEGTLRQLREAGYFLGVATLKREIFAEDMLRRQGLLPYFDVVCGMDEGDSATKSDLIKRCMRYANVSGDETVLVGDSAYDAVGAAQAGVTFLAVTYGFGFQDREAAIEAGAAMTAETAEEIGRLLSRG